jgi:hypothetical protein
MPTIIYWVKLEEGTIPSAWSPATGDKVDTSKTSPTMNWIMKPTECIWWNQDGNSVDQYLMKLDDNGLKLRGSLEVTGSLWAGLKENGIVGNEKDYAVRFSANAAKNMYISGWEIDHNSLFYGPTSKTGTGYAMNAHSFICPTGWHEYAADRVNVGGFIAPIPPDNGWVDYWALKLGNNFGVSTEGVLHCANA